MFFKISNYIKGYVVINIEGIFPERFINLCSKKQISLWNIHRISKNSISAHIGIKDFKKIRKICKNSRCKVHIQRKYGLRFFLHKHRKRKALAMGLIIFFTALWVLSKFVWIIEITGNDKIPKEEIIKCAEAGGLSPGMLATSVDSHSIKNHIMSNMEDVAFVTVNTVGTTVKIDIREREEKREHFDKNAHSNIVASESGVIESILVQSGTAAVKRGDVVYKGQLLVSGATDNSYLGIKYSNSDAVVKARVWHEKTVNLPYYIEEKVPTGNEKNMRKLKILNFSLNLYIKNKILFEKCDILSYTNYITLGKDKTLPIGIETVCCKEYRTTKTKLTDEQTKNILFEEFDELYKNSEILNRSFKIKDNKMTVTYECIEEIGRKEELNDNRKTSGS